MNVPPKRFEIVGVGNRWRRDDGAGLAVAEALRPLAPEEATVTLSEGDPLDLLLDRPQLGRLILIDAAAVPRGACQVHRFEVGEFPPGSQSPASSHAFGLAETLELARALGLLPERTAVYAVEGWDFSHGEGLSPEAARAVRECVESVRRAEFPAVLASGK